MWILNAESTMTRESSFSFMKGIRTGSRKDAKKQRNTKKKTATDLRTHFDQAYNATCFAFLYFASLRLCGIFLFRPPIGTDLFPKSILQDLREFPDHRQSRIFLVISDNAHVVDVDGHRDAAATGVDDTDIGTKAVEST